MSKQGYPGVKTSFQDGNPGIEIALIGACVIILPVAFSFTVPNVREDLTWPTTTVTVTSVAFHCQTDRGGRRFRRYETTPCTQEGLRSGNLSKVFDLGVAFDTGEGRRVRTVYVVPDWIRGEYRTGERIELQYDPEHPETLHTPDPERPLRGGLVIGIGLIVLFFRREIAMFFG